MFYFFHFRYEISRSNHPFISTATRYNQLHIWRFYPYKSKDIFCLEQSKPDSTVNLIQNYQVVFAASQRRFGKVKGLTGDIDILGIKLVFEIQLSLPV